MKTKLPDNHISIVISTRNAEPYVDRCLESALNQNYPDFEVIFIDACSTDDTYNKALKYLENYNNLKVIKNETRKYQGENIRIGTEMSPYKSIICTLDGDDWFAHDSVLARVNAEYKKHDCWMTHGTYCEFHGNDQPLRDVSQYYFEYPLEIRQSKGYRSYRWLASHLRTFRRELFMLINPEDMKDPKTGDYVSCAPDLSFQFPMLEMCSPHKIRYLPDITYVYNRENSQNESKTMADEIIRIEALLRAKPPYQTVEHLYDQ